MVLLTFSSLFISFHSYLEHFSIIQRKSHMVWNYFTDTDLQLGLLEFTFIELLVLGRIIPPENSK